MILIKKNVILFLIIYLSFNDVHSSSCLKDGETLKLTNNWAGFLSSVVEKWAFSRNLCESDKFYKVKKKFSYLNKNIFKKFHLAELETEYKELKTMYISWRLHNEEEVSAVYKKLFELANRIFDKVISNADLKERHLSEDAEEKICYEIDEFLNGLPKYIGVDRISNEFVEKAQGLKQVYGKKIIVKKEFYHSLKRNKKSLITYSPETGWANDPNGLILVDETYHLFYQYNPMEYPKYLNWGHAVSRDLVNWEETNIAISADIETLENIYSGSVVYDKNNSSGLGEGKHGPLVAIYTSHYSYHESQSIAFSNDKGKTWYKYIKNPVIPHPPKRYEKWCNSFRDPKVFWYPQKKKWVMVVVLSVRQIVLFYVSDNLINWSHISEFVPKNLHLLHLLECPDLIQMELSGTNESKWVLLLSIRLGIHYPNSSRYVRYFIGNFDGTQFVEENSDSSKIKRIDYGSDFYAAQTWNGENEKKHLIGWVNNWGYAINIVSKYRGGLSLVREVNIIKKDNDYKLIQTPIEAIQEYTKEEYLYRKDEATVGIIMNGDHAYNIIINITSHSADKLSFTLLIKDEKKQQASIFYIPDKKTIYIEKEHVHPNYFGKFIKNSAKFDGSTEINLKIFIDSVSLTVFCNNGEIVFTEILLSNSKIRKFIFVDNSTASSNNVSVQMFLLQDLYPPRNVPIL